MRFQNLVDWYQNYFAMILTPMKIGFPPFQMRNMFLWIKHWQNILGHISVSIIIIPTIIFMPISGPVAEMIGRKKNIDY